MLKCPFCNFDNEEGALFCEQCKSDLSGVEPAPAAPPVPVAHVLEETIPMAQPMPVAEAEVVAAVVEATPAAPPPAAPVEPEVSAAPPVEPAAPAPPAAAPAPLAADAQPKLVVIRGQKLNAEYPIYPDLNFI